jgi:probable F420-dependent oxidoreductase
MRFGLYSSIANPPRGEHLERAVDEVIAEAELAESLGFDSCFFGEHHQDRDGFLPSPLIVATAVAARTKTLRVGTSVILLPLHHPVRIAEDVITLDLVSKGRIVLGVGIGYQADDFRAFGVPFEDRMRRFEESVEIIRLCWAGERFSFRGKHYTLEDVQITPRPFQKPGPPLWIGASVPAAARRAGRIADGFVGTPSTGLENATRLADLYKAAAREAGPAGRGHPDAGCVGGDDAGGGRPGVRPARDDGLPLLLGATAGRVRRHAARDEVHPGEPGARPADPGGARDVRAEFQRWQKVTGRRHVPAAPAPRALRRAAARRDHEGDPALRRARAALLP